MLMKMMMMLLISLLLLQEVQRVLCLLPPLLGHHVMHQRWHFDDDAHSKTHPTSSRSAEQLRYDGRSGYSIQSTYT